LPERTARGTGVRRGEGSLVIERVKHLEAELETMALGEPEILQQRKVYGVIRSGADVAQPERKGPDVVGQLLGRVAVESGVGVKPSLRRAAARRDVGEFSVENHVAEAERLAAGDEPDRIELPAAD